jgi:predicted permease
VLAYLMLDVLRPLAPGNFPRIDDIEINTGVLVFAALVAAGSVLLSGAAPLARVLRVDPIENLRGGMSREIGGRHRIALLPAIGVGLATTALVTALALSMSLMRLGDVDPGFRTANIAALQMFRQGPLASVSPFAERVLEEIRSVPGVRDVVAVSSAPLSVVGRSPIDVAVQGGDLPENIPAVVRHATGGYHRFLGVPIVNGRDISDRDVAGVPNAVVINETLARRAFGTADPLGRTLLLPAITSAERVPFTIVGVSADTRNTGLRAPTEPELIVSVQQVAWNTGVTLLVDSAATSANWLRTLQDAVLRVDPNQPSYRSYMLADDLDAQTRNSRFFASATGWFAMLALLLGAVGVNAVVAAMQRERTREIGLRLALGAAPRKAAALVFSNAARIVALGLVIGVVLAIPAFGWLRDQLFAVSGSAFGALYGVTSVVLILVSFVAASWPAWRAASTAPMEVLRHE